MPKGSRSAPAADEDSCLSLLLAKSPLSNDDQDDFIRLAEKGLRDFERAQGWVSTESPTIDQVPAPWARDPELLGYIFLRVSSRASPALTDFAARLLLRGAADDDAGTRSPGLAAAWLMTLDRSTPQSIDADAVFKALRRRPADTLLGLAKENYLKLAQALVRHADEEREATLIQILLALESTDPHGRTTCRFFEDLIAANWLETSTKAALCWMLIGRAAPTDDVTPPGTPDAEELARRAPALRRHAARSLPFVLEREPSDVIAELFLRPADKEQTAEAINLGVMDIIERQFDELDPLIVRQWLFRAIREACPLVRKSAYQIGLARFGRVFARRAARDRSRVVRQWAVRKRRGATGRALRAG